MGNEQYRELYGWMSAVLEHEHERFRRIDEKAIWYLAVITLLVGVECAFGKTIFHELIHPATRLQWWLSNVAIASNILFAAGGLIILRALRMVEFKYEPLSPDLIEFVNFHTHVNICHHVASANGVAWVENTRITNKKARALFFGHCMTIGAVIAITLFIALLILQAWNTVPFANGGQKIGRASGGLSSGLPEASGPGVLTHGKTLPSGEGFAASLTHQ